jgi:hypothetical protein
MEGPNITVISDPSPEELDLSSSSSEDFKVIAKLPERSRIILTVLLVQCVKFLGGKNMTI